MDTAALLGKFLAPRIARLPEQTLYKLDRFLHHAEIIRLQGRSWRVHDRQHHRTPAVPAEA